MGEKSHALTHIRKRKLLILRSCNRSAQMPTLAPMWRFWATFRSRPRKITAPGLLVMTSGSSSGTGTQWVLPSWKRGPTTCSSIASR